MAISILISQNSVSLFAKDGYKTYYLDDLQSFEDALSLYAQSSVKIYIDSVDEALFIEETPAVSVFDAQPIHLRLRKKLFKHSLRAFSSMDKKRLLADAAHDTTKHYITGISNTKGIDVWLDKIQQSRLLVTGIYSLALSMSHAFSVLGITNKHVLVVYKNEDDTYKHVFYTGKQLEFSRVIHKDSEGVPLEFFSDLQDTLAFIKARKQLDSIHIHVIGAEFDSLENLLSDDEIGDIRFHTHDFDAGNAYLVSLLLDSHSIVNHYATPAELKPYKIKRTSKCLWSLFYLLFLLGLGLMGFWAYQAYKANQEYETVTDNLSSLLSAYQKKATAQKQFKQDPRQIKKGIDWVDCMKKQSENNPNTALIKLSHVMARFDQLQVNKLVWTNQSTPVFDCMPSEPTAEKIGENDQPRHGLFSLVVNAKMIGEDLSPRQVNALVSLLQKTLLSQPWVSRVDVLEVPYSFEPSQAITLSDKVSDQKPKIIKFEIQGLKNDS